jgi:hypothetical protein
VIALGVLLGLLVATASLLTLAIGGNAHLVAENRRLRAENARLRRHPASLQLVDSATAPDLGGAS